MAIATFLGRPAPAATGCVEICCYRLPAHTAHCPVWTRAANDPSVFTMTEKAPIRASSWLKALTSAFTFKTLLCDCENRWIVCSSSLDTVAAQAYLIPQSPHSLHCTTQHYCSGKIRKSYRRPFSMSQDPPLFWFVLSTFTGYMVSAWTWLGPRVMCISSRLQKQVEKSPA